jgi:hypothetical protein
MSCTIDSMHEDLTRRHEQKSSSNRVFGLVMAAFFAVVGVAPRARGHAVHWPAVAVGVAFAMAALAAPSVLGPLNRLWTRFGVLLNRVVSPVILGILFYVVLTPCGAVMRAFGKDPLTRGRDPKVKTYWTLRDPAAKTGGSMTQQF